ncbi:MAG: hypothetical protein GX328_00580 [Clostridiaceae bacterium]|nr:hypothetical protein [Clostridiaceae bacterium]
MFKDTKSQKDIKSQKDTKRQIVYRKSKVKFQEENGGIVFDAAIIIPLIIIICYFMLSATLTVQHEIIMRYALDQTAKELSLIVPLAEGIASEIEHSSIDNLINSILPESASEFRQAAGDLAGSIFLQNFLQTRIEKWLIDGADRLKIKIPSDQRQIILTTVSDHSLQLKMIYHIKTPWTTTEKSAISYVPIWTKYDSKYQLENETNDEHDDTEDNIWSQHNFTRGKYFREQYKANLPFNYPTICRYQAGEITAVRSLDLTAPSYNSPEKVKLQFEQEINNLAIFSGSERDTGLSIGKITANDISKRKLIIVIPGNSDYDINSEMFNNIKTYASGNGVTIQFDIRGNSYRYLPKPETDNSDKNE